jgi:ribosome maturation factor RimP
MKNIAENVEKLIEPIVNGFGLEIVEVEYRKIRDEMNLTVFIDKDGGVTLDDCEKVHKAIKHYILNVSSPGLDRPLKNAKDYKRNTGKPVKASLYSPFQGRKQYEGILISWTDDSVTLEVNNDEIVLNKKDISIIKPII